MATFEHVLRGWMLDETEGQTGRTYAYMAGKACALSFFGVRSFISRHKADRTVLCFFLIPRKRISRSRRLLPYSNDRKTRRKEVQEC